MMPSAVQVAGQDVFTIQADAGGFTHEERTTIVERNINNALMASTDRSPSTVAIEYINSLPVVRLGGFHVVTITDKCAQMAGTTMAALADVWAGNLRRVLSDQAFIANYVGQLGGDFLSSPYVSPFRRARCEAARLNHAAFMFREDIPVGLQCSQSFANKGMVELNAKRDTQAALESFKNAIAMDSGNAKAHYGLGLCLLKCGNVNQAIVELQKARWLEPNYAYVHIALGQAFETQGHDVDAIKQYQEAALLQPENPEPYLLIADIREDRNDMGKSVVELQNAQNIIPKSDYIRLRKQDQLAWRLRRPM